MMLPDNRNSTARNGAESESNIKVTGLVSSVAAGTVSSLAFDDRHAAYLAGRADGKAEAFTAEVADAVQAALQDRTREALGMAKRYASVKGPAWTAMITECGERP